MSAIKLPVRAQLERVPFAKTDRALVIDADEDVACVVSWNGPGDCTTEVNARAAQIVAALNLAPALAALEAIARERLAEREYREEFALSIFRPESDTDPVARELALDEAKPYREGAERARAALALAGATLDGNSTTTPNPERAR